jgi:hypothetical protein
LKVQERIFYSIGLGAAARRLRAPTYAEAILRVKHFLAESSGRGLFPEPLNQMAHCINRYSIT